jgi:hypothetical protein
MSNLTKEVFEGITNKDFEVFFNQEKSSKCQLIEVKSSGIKQPKNSQVEGFSLLLQTTDLNIYEQSSYEMKNQELGDLALFLVPVYGDDKVIQYEAIFN